MSCSKPIILFCLLCAPFPALMTAVPASAQAVAAPAAQPVFSVDEAVALAIKQNPRLSAAAREIAAARAGVRSAGALTNPSITFAPGITSLSGTGEELLAQQPLELNGTRSARKGVAGAQLRQRQAEAIVQLRSLVLDTRTAFYELARAQELRSLSAELLKTAEELGQITRRQVEVGTRPGIEQTQTAIEVSRARQQFTHAESRVTVAAVALNTLLGRQPSDPVGPLAPAKLSDTVPDADSARQRAVGARAEIAAAEAVRDTLRGEARLVRAQGRPDLAPQFRAGSVTREFSDTGVGIGITLPFLDYGSRRGRLRQLEEAERAQEDRITAERSRVLQEVEQALARVAAAETVLKDYQQGLLQQARTLLEGSQKGFQAGLTTVVALLEAQRTYRTVLTEYTNAITDHALAYAALEHAVGSVSPDLLPAVGSEPRKH